MIKKDWESKQEINREKLSEKEENRKREYGKDRYCNMSKETKQRLKGYQKNSPKAKKPQYDNE